MKLIIRFFIALCFFLLNGYNQLYAFGDLNGNPIARVLAVSDNARVHPLKYAEALKSVMSIPEIDESEQFDISIIEDDDNDPVKKQFLIKDTGVFSYSGTSAYLSGCVKRRLQLYENFSFPTLSRYIILQVMRIWFWNLDRYLKIVF